MRKIERTVAPSDNTRVAVRKEFVSIPLNQEQKQNLKIYGTLNKPETKQTELNQGRKLSPGEQVVRDKKLAKQSDLEEYQERKEKEAKDLEQALVVAPYVIPGIGQAMWAGKAVDLAVSGASDGKYKSWGNMVDQKTGSGEFIGELTNPGYYAGAFPKLVGKGIQSTSKYALQKAEPYLMGDKMIPMGVSKPRQDFWRQGFEGGKTTIMDDNDKIILIGQKADNFLKKTTAKKLYTPISNDQINSAFKNSGVLSSRVGSNNSPVFMTKQHAPYHIEHSNFLPTDIEPGVIVRGSGSGKNTAKHDVLNRFKFNLLEDPNIELYEGNRLVPKSELKQYINVKKQGGILKHQEGGLLYPKVNKLIKRTNQKDIDFVNRLKDPNRKSITNWSNPKEIATHKMS